MLNFFLYIIGLCIFVNAAAACVHSMHVVVIRVSIHTQGQLLALALTPSNALEGTQSPSN